VATDDNTRARIAELARAFEEEGGHAEAGSYAIEDWVTFAVFWCLVGCLVLQFFSRYVLNNSFAWTEEVASNGLVVVVFLGSVMCVRLGRHIRVDILHRLIPPRAARALQVVVELLTIAFFAHMTWLVWRYISLVGHERMITVDLSRGWIFNSVLAAFALMFLRAVQRFASRRGAPETDPGA
jgi:TRAP-type C4-dicarboxylate transport system permease small subunit